MLGRAERYSIERRDGDVVLLMKQGAIWIEQLPIHDEGPIFPYRVHFLDASGNDAALFIELQRRGSVDRMLDTLRTAVTLDVHDRRPV